MLFIVQFQDVYSEKPELLPLRAEVMPAHINFLEANADKVIASGALRDAPDSQPLGGVWIIAASDRSSVEALYQEDPFWKAGLRKSVTVRHWSKAAWSPAFTEAMSAIGES